jgi:hypothetical protein
MLTPAANWLTACNSGAELRVLFSIDNGVDPAWTAVSGYCSLIDAPVAVTNVAAIATEVDPLTRQQQSGELTVEVSDSWLRPILVANRIKGKKGTIKIGFADIAEADFIAAACGPIEEISPSGPRDHGTVTIALMDLATVLQSQDLLAAWINYHPLECLYDGAAGKSAFSRCGYNSSTWVDEDSFNPEDADYASNIGHLVVSRVQAFDVYEKTSAFELVQQVCQLLYGQVSSDESGKLVFKRFDASAASVDDWTIDDIIEGSIEQDPLDSNVVNQVIVKFAGAEPSTDHPAKTLIFNDTDSQTAYAYPGATTRVITHEIETAWAPGNHMAPLHANFAAGATTLLLGGPGAHGLSGMREAMAGVHANCQISAARPLWLLLSPLYSDAAYEVIKATTSTIGSPTGNAQWFDWSGAGWTQTQFKFQTTLTNITRAQLGTADVLHEYLGTNATYVWDITSVVQLAQAILQRFKYGCPIIRLATPINKIAIQQGDLVTVTCQDLLAYGADGYTSSTKWEVISKEIDPMASPPQIKWGLALAGSTAWNPGFGFRGSAQHEQGSIYDEMRSTERTDVAQAFVAEGGATTATGGLTAQVAAGVYSSGSSRVARTAATSYTVNTNKDTYVTADPYTGTLTSREVATGAAAPDKMASEVWVSKIVSDGVSVTSVVDLRETLAVPGSRLKAGTGPLVHLAQTTGVLDNVTSITTRALDDITDGATYKKVTGVNGTTHRVQAASIADAAVAGVHVATGDARQYANVNHNFQQWTRG